jgi:ADP-heptose:LPS heptosyltransferase
MNGRRAPRHRLPRLKARVRRILGVVLRAAAWCAARAIPRREPKTWTPRRILLMNGAHIGDVVIATSLIPVLRSAYPEAKIGFVAGSWASMTVRDHPEIAWVHEIDHWRLNRKAGGRLRKLAQWAKTRQNALGEIRGVGYDLSLSIYPVYPDFLDVAWQAGIPVRAGYRSSRFAPLATRWADFPVGNPFLTQGARQAEILRPLGIAEEHLEKRGAVLREDDAEAIAEVCATLGVSDLAATRYQVIHMGSGLESHQLPVEFWRKIAQASEGVVLFTGQGSREASRIERAIAGLEHCVNGCGRLSWKGFVAAVRHAEALYGVDSMAGHVAGAVGTPCRVVYSGAAGVARWRPEGESSLVFTRHLPCAPCEYGCPDRECLLGVKAAEVIHTP